MAIISFHLRNPKADKPKPVFMSLYADGKQTKIKTGLRVSPRQWSMDEQKCKTRGKGLAQSNGETNDDLAGMAKRAEAYYGEQRTLGRIPSGSDIWEAIRPVSDKKEKVDVDAPMPLPDFAGYLTKLKGSRTPNTIKAKRTAYNHLCDYAASTGQPLGYADFNRAWKDGFTAYLANVVKLADNTLSKQLAIVRGFLTYAHEHGRTPRVDVSGWTWKYKEPEVVALTAAELAQVEQLSNLPEHLENARDLFLLMCYTALRYSDAVRLKKEHDKGEYLELMAEKTDDVLTIYIRRKLRPILNRYWAGKVRLIQNRALNEHIKELCKLAGMTEPVERVRHYDQTSRTVKEMLPKYELIGCHSGRRTFVTLSIEQDAPTDVVMQATGHRNHRTLQRYNKTTAARQVAAMRKVLGEEGE